MERVKMPRRDRAKQFAPFDALKGLHEALAIKEYQHEQVEKGELAPEQVEKISKRLANLKKGDRVTITYYDEGHIKQLSGEVKLFAEERTIQVGKDKILLDCLLDID